MKMIGKISKADEHKVFGWANVTSENGELITDWQGDQIDTQTLEEAVYEFVLNSGQGGEMHQTKGGALLIESLMLTKRKAELLGMKGDREGWWVGFKIVDESLWDKIKSGQYRMFSIGGTARRTQDEQID